MSKIISLVSGIIFGVGLVISEMINPEKVLGFLDLFGNWDPSLAFVMIGALIVSSPLFHIIKNKEKPLFAEKFNYSNNKEVNNRLIVGSALFGAGWGLGGTLPWSSYIIYCIIEYKLYYICCCYVCWFLFSKIF
jgi:uncharacterized membrane protein YedE/YeeE